MKESNYISIILIFQHKISSYILGSRLFEIFDEKALMEVFKVPSDQQAFEIFEIF